jgi:galactofuranosylgalactofuranosylrhamnosyl-N-acetylglucosaminyl-diphospho-decaprenol beta-1,5/1,6-galactofuranosyltransferase
MNLPGSVIHHLKLCEEGGKGAAYFRLSEGARYVSEDEISIGLKGEVSFDSYFNCIYESFLLTETSIKEFYFKLELVGSVTAELYRRDQAGKESLIFQSSYEGLTAQSPVRIDVPHGGAASGSTRVFLKLTGKSSDAAFKKGWIATDQAPLRQVNLAVVSCTFKKEPYIVKTIENLSRDAGLATKELKVFVIDNGRTLAPESFKDPRVELVPNRNLGGSGGFTCGIEAAFRGSFTHILLMDDDIDLESESIFRLISFYEYSVKEVAVSGSMLDSFAKKFLYEMGGSIGKGGFFARSGPFTLAGERCGLNLEKPETLDTVMTPFSFDYGAWWYFAFPSSALKTVGFPMPFFIKADDVEYSLRLKSHGIAVVAPPGIAVWHDPFYAKPPTWEAYFTHRNLLMLYSLGHRGVPRRSYFALTFHLTKKVISALSIFDYNTVRFLHKSLEDYLKGPSFLMETDAEELFGEILSICKNSKTQQVASRLSGPPSEASLRRPSFLNLISALFTLNGHFGRIWGKRDHLDFNPPYLNMRGRFAQLGLPEFVFSNHFSKQVFTHKLDAKLGRSLLMQWFKLVWRGAFSVRSVRKGWRDALPEISSHGFWKSYLEKSKNLPRPAESKRAA